MSIKVAQIKGKFHFFKQFDLILSLSLWDQFSQQMSANTPYPPQLPPRVTTVARKSSRSSCPRYRWQVTAKHACTLRMWLCMKWRDMVHGWMVYTEHAETAAVSRGTIHVTTKQRCKYTTSVNIKTRLKNPTVTHLGSLQSSFRITCDINAMSLLERANSAV